MRILHLIDPAGPGGGPCTLKLLAETVSRAAGHHDVVVFGTGEHLDLARRCGITPRGRIGAALNRPVLARAALATLLNAGQRSGGRYDLIHAWTLGSAVAAVRAARGQPVLATAAACAVRWPADLRVLARHRVPVLAATAHVQAGLVAAGYPREVVSVLTPAVDPGSIAMEQRRLLRASWDADETTYVVALLTEPVQIADNVHAINAAARALLTGKDVRIVVHHGAAPLRLRLEMSAAGLRDLIIVDDRVVEPWRIVAGLDLAMAIHRAPRLEARRSWGVQVRGAVPVLHMLPGPAPEPYPRMTPLIWATAAGVPVIAEDQYAGDWIEEGRTGLLTSTADYNRTAARILDLYDNPALARRITAEAQAQVETRFSPDLFVGRLAVAWDQARRREAVVLPEDEVARVVERRTTGELVRLGRTRSTVPPGAQGVAR
ncbi:MAG: glycosyltransferase [Planctomycetes bacterium]|nr:glycosyltransferase [Planctomycetota bacterium]